ncbi:hypothetical protein C8Q79DRAFT_976044 [Trametes meyenii]|nr:hypothetical protein C8Q79DRAFT_976044 [Trametes meyenii]
MAHDEDFLSGNDIFAELTEVETFWKDRQPFSHGYMLRPRYRPGWIPSWQRDPTTRILAAEDRIMLHAMRPHLMDARRIVDNKLVLFKRVRTDSPELSVALFLSNPENRSNPRNHCIPILEILQDPEDETLSYIIMPFLRYIDSPAFETVGEILDCCEQLLEGLAFLHAQDVAHRDCAYRNIMMDAEDLYPQGFHPINQRCLPHSILKVAPVWSRKDIPVRYYYVDFGISTQFQQHDVNRLVVGAEGLDQDVPELSADVPYDPFKVDVFVLGNMFRQQFIEKFKNLNVLTPLVQAMCHPKPAERPTAEQSLQIWRRLRRGVYSVHALWRPRPRDEPVIFTAVLDAISFCSVTYRSLF